MAVSKETLEAFDRIAESSLCVTDGPDIDLLECIVSLCDAIAAEDCEDDSWLYLGEFGEFTAPDFIVGAYWALEGWTGDEQHAANAAYYALGEIFRPGTTSGPEPESSEEWRYQIVNSYMESLNA